MEISYILKSLTHWMACAVLLPGLWGCSSGNGDSAKSAALKAHPEVQLALSDVALVMQSGDEHKIGVRITPRTPSPDLNVAELKVNWVSECPEVAAVDSLGIVRAIAPGRGYIRASVSNRDVQANAASCLVTVKDSTTPNDTISDDEGIEVFGGKARYDEKRHLIVFSATYRIAVPGSSRGITMNKGDRIYDVRLRGGCLVSGIFAKGSNQKAIEGLSEAL